MDDWKSMLSGLLDSGEIPTVEDNQEADAPEKEVTKEIQKAPLAIILDKKGRKGKTATIIEGFLCDDATVSDIAKQLQKSIGTGGSSRGGEILLQGDCRQAAAKKLQALGYKVKL